MNKLNANDFTFSLFSFIFLLFSFTSKASLLTAIEQDNITHLSTISIATGSQFYPYVDEKLPKNGWSSAIVQAAFEQVNINHNIEIYPWIRVSELTKQQIHDVAYPYAKTAERQKDFYFSDPINFVPVKILLRKSITDKTIEDLKKYTFCIPLGYVPPTALLTVISVENTTSAQTTLDCLKKIKVGWADIVVYNRFNQISDTLIGKDLRWSTLKIASEPLFLMVSKTHPNGAKILHAFNQGLKEITENKQLKKINEQYAELIYLHNFQLKNGRKDK
jgi:polar amino acid transport system substrate-binding protein